MLTLCGIEQHMAFVNTSNAYSKLPDVAATTMVFEAQITELKDQINNLNLNVNPSPDKIANIHRNEVRFNRKQQRDNQRHPDMSEIICRNCAKSGYYAKYCPNPKDISRVICDYCGGLGYYARNCFHNPNPTYVRTIPT